MPIEKIHVENDPHGREWIEVTASPVSVPHLKPLRFFVHRGYGAYSEQWSVTEAITGRSICYDWYRNKAIHDAKALLATKTLEEMQARIDKYAIT